MAVPLKCKENALAIWKTFRYRYTYTHMYGVCVCECMCLYIYIFDFLKRCTLVNNFICRRCLVAGTRTFRLHMLPCSLRGPDAAPRFPICVSMWTAGSSVSFLVKLHKIVFRFVSLSSSSSSMLLLLHLKCAFKIYCSQSRKLTAY